MVATEKTTNEISSQKIKKGFHAKYVKLCKGKNIQPLPEVKSKQKNLHMVDFHADRLRVYDWIAICDALETDRSLKICAIRLRKNDEMIFEDIDTLKKTKSIKTHPVIYSKFIFMELLNALQSMLSHNPHLEVLTLEGLPIYGRYMNHLVKGLCSNRSLKVINFSRTNMGDEACEILCANIKHLTNIESVNLSHCNLGVKGATAIRDFIRFQKIHRFSEAWIRSLRYQNVDAAHFDGVKKIFLNNNPMITDEGLEILADELREDVWIKEIEVQNCGLTHVSANIIMDCLKINKTILNFNVNNNSEIPDQLQRHIMFHFSSSSSSGDGDSLASNDAKIIKQKITKSQLIDNVKFLEDQLESEIFRRKELEKINEQLYKQLNEVQREMSINNTINIPDGYTLVTNEELQKIIYKKSTITHRNYSNAAVRLRRKRKPGVQKVCSYTQIPHHVPQLISSKSENKLNVDITPKRMFIEKNIGDSINNVGMKEENSFELLRCFMKKNMHQNNNSNNSENLLDCFKRKSLIAPSNSRESSCE